MMRALTALAASLDVRRKSVSRQHETNELKAQRALAASSSEKYQSSPPSSFAIIIRHFFADVASCKFHFPFTTTPTNSSTTDDLFEVPTRQTILNRRLSATLAAKISSLIRSLLLTGQLFGFFSLSFRRRGSVCALGPLSHKILSNDKRKHYITIHNGRSTILLFKLDPRSRPS